ncbi:hypothetical protein HZA57_01490 [Candidatus Poribacteria bacterium]|nr:hypothetical protein [Candidatus Poribacteria bacterium]
MSRHLSFRNLLSVIALLLAANLAVVLARPGAGPSLPINPPIQAGDFYKIDGAFIVTANAEGDTLYVWQLGRLTTDGYETITARTYSAAATK